MNFSTANHLNILDLKHFDVETLSVESHALKKNPLKDSSCRHNPVLVPKKKLKRGTPVVFVLAGFSGTGPKYFNYKSFEDNMPQEIDSLAGKKQAPAAIYVFVEAMTFWGGSQFRNSPATGRYEDYIVDELYSAVLESYQEWVDVSKVCIMGGSSGGYGVLHLASKYPYKFSYAAAIAPDSFFERSILPDIYKAIPVITKFGGIKGVEKELRKGRSGRIPSLHTVMNAIGMASCYSSGRETSFSLPVDMETGELNKEIWKSWKACDPINFLPKRLRKLSKLQRIYLDVGSRDQYNLQFGARQIRKIFKDNRLPHDYSEFDGSHFDIGKRRAEVWSWLMKHW